MRIGIVGPLGSGKSTVARLLCDHYDFRRRPLAQPLKQIADGMGMHEKGEYREGFVMDWAQELLPDPLYQDINRHSDKGYTTQEMFVDHCIRAYETAIDQRHLYQMIGTDIGRAINEYIWLDNLARNLKEGNVGVDDVRFVNEGQYLERLGFWLVRVHIEPEVLVDRVTARDGSFDPTKYEHASEQEMIHIDCHHNIWNNGSPDELERQVFTMVHFFQEWST